MNLTFARIFSFIRKRYGLFYFLLLIFFSGCSQPSLFKETRLVMDTFIEISCFGSDRKSALEAMKAAFGEVERLDKFFNRFDKKSGISRINNLAGTEELFINPELFGIIERFLYYSRLSGGSFDITVAPFVDIWKGALENKSIPDNEILGTTLECVGYKNIIMDKERSSIRFLKKGTKIDLGGIAKGYALDRARDVLVSYGVENALINIGGNIFALGSPPGKKSWQIGIRHPRDKNDIVHRLDLKNRAISTSGDYERFFILEGRRYSHIINPLDGRPSEGVMSVTVAADTGELADMLSTAVFVMGIEKGLEFVRSFEHVEAFIFDKEGKVVKYPEMSEKNLSLQH